MAKFPRVINLSEIESQNKKKKEEQLDKKEKIKLSYDIFVKSGKEQKKNSRNMY